MENPTFKELKGNLKTKMGSELCREWRRTHTNCKGCPSSNACREWALRAMQYTTQTLIASGDLPEDYDPNKEIY